MTAASALAASHAIKGDVTLLIDGLPVLFGTRAGLVHPGTGVNNDPTLTSVAAIIPGSLRLGGTELDFEKLVVPPQSASLSIRYDAAWNRHFLRRATPQARLTAAVNDDAGTATLTLNSTSGFASGDVVYVGREAMGCDGVVGNQLSISARNYCSLPGSAPSVHSIGAPVTRQPQNWIGRMAELRFWPSTTPGDSFLLCYLRFAGSPVRDAAGTWAFDFDNNARLLDRQIAVGFKGAKIGVISHDQSGSGVTTQGLYTLQPAGDEYGPAGNQHREFQDTSIDLGHIAVQAGDDGFIALYVDVCAVSGRVGQPQVLLPGGNVVPDDETPYDVLVSNFSGPVQDWVDGGWQMRRCCVFSGPPMVAALQVLLSCSGTGTNHATYDVLYGVTSTSGGTDGRLEAGEAECRFGAAIPAALVEIPSTEILTRTVPGFRYILLEEMNLLDFLSDIARALNGAWYQNSDGKLAFRVFESDFSADTYSATLTSESILRGTPLLSVDDESQVVHTVGVKCNWSPFAKMFLGSVTVRDSQLCETYRDIAGAISMDRRGLIVSSTGQRFEDVVRVAGVAQPTDVPSLITQMDRALFRRRQVRKYTMVLPWRYCQLLVGDRIRITFDKFLDFAGSTLSSFAGMIVKITPDIQLGTIEIDVIELLAAKLIPPVSQVASWSGGPPQVATLVTTDKWGGASTPGAWWAVGWKIKMLDASASPQFSVVSGVLTVTAQTNTTVTVTGAVGFTPAAGDLVVMADYDNANSTVTQPGAPFLTQHDYVFMADASFYLGAANVAGYVWG